MKVRPTRPSAPVMSVLAFSSTSPALAGNFALLRTIDTSPAKVLICPIASAHAAWVSVMTATSTVQTTTARCQFPIAPPYPFASALPRLEGEDGSERLPVDVTDRLTAPAPDAAPTRGGSCGSGHGPAQVSARRHPSPRPGRSP